MSDVVRDKASALEWYEAEEQGCNCIPFEDSDYIPYELYGHEMHFHSEKGGIWNAPNRRMTQFILSNNKPANRLLCVGKSYGARDICETLLLISDKLKYDKVYLVTVDPAWIGSRHQKDVLWVPNCVDRGWNVYQWQHYPRGCRVWEGESSRHTMGRVTNMQDFYADHFDIIEGVKCKAAIETAIKQICEGWE
jgi:hypothetical protein